jgi:DNA polymerase-3 subunit beta
MLRAKIDGESLRRAARLLERVTSRATLRPVLKAVHLEADGGTTVVASATDLATTVRVRVDCEGVEADGPALVDGRLLRVALTSRAETLALRASEKRAEIRAGESRFRLALLDPAEYPELPKLESGGKALELDAAEFSAAVGRAASSVATENMRYALAAVHMVVESKARKGGKAKKAKKGAVQDGDRRLALVGFDGRRLTVAECAVAGGRLDDLTFLARPAALSLLARLPGEVEDEWLRLSVDGDDGRLRASRGGACVWTLAVEGRFPAWRDMIPTGEHQTLCVDSAAFQDALKQLDCFRSLDSNAVRLTVGKNGLALKARSAEAGEGEVGVPVLGGSDAEPGWRDFFQPQFLADAATACPADALTLELREPVELEEGVRQDAPVVFRDERTTVVIAPFAVAGGSWDDEQE